jgi:hypothetical protein
VYTCPRKTTTTTRRKECPMQSVKERLSVLYDSYTTKQLKIE